MTQLEQIRVLLKEPAENVWTDSDLAAHLEMCGGDVHRAAGAALRSYAAERARKLHRIKDKDQEFERNAIKDLLALAASYESMAGGSSSGSILLESGDDTYAGWNPAWIDS